MRPLLLCTARRWGWLPCVAVVSIVLLSSFAVPAAARGSGSFSAKALPPAATATVSTGPSLATIEASGFAPVRDSVSDAVLPGSTPGPRAPTGSLEVVVSFSHANQSRLSLELAAISDPNSSSYHRYLSRSAFDAAFGAPLPTYREAVTYFASFGVSDLTTYPDRGSISFVTSPAVADQVFGTTVASFDDHGRSYLAPTAPLRLPRTIAPAVAEVLGLGTGSALTAEPGTWGEASSAGSHGPEEARVGATTFVAPPTDHGVQLEYGPDLQVAYDEESLFAADGYPTNASIAFLTAGGGYATGPPISTPCATLVSPMALGGWDPADVSSYFNATLPAGEPDPSIVPVPIGGAPPSNCSASWDTTGVVAANTVDLEMIGSTAPGATIYGIYTPQPGIPELDSAFSQALTYAGLNVVVTPWGFNDTNNSGWYSDLEEAQAVGVTVLAASGNSGGDPESPAWVGSDAEFPSSAASLGPVTSIGVVAVGGTTLTLNRSTLQIASEIAWNVSARDLSFGWGSSGGLSLVFPEPFWQKNTSANSVIGGKDRGVPDIAALANNTVATVSIDGDRLNALNASGTNATSSASVNQTFFRANGTGIAASLVAGLFAEVDHVLICAHDPALGFPDPLIYYVANLEYGALPNGTVHYSTPTSPDYVSPLPSLPFHDVTQGRNAVDSAATGYDLVTGWGSLDAYNYTMYLLDPAQLPSYGLLSAVQDRIHLTGLHVNTTFPNGTVEFAGFSVQQNLFLANSFGAPIYWVQNVVYVAYESPGKWAINFTGWVFYPSWPLYPTLSVVETDYPAESHADTIPFTLNLTTYLTASPSPLHTVVGFSFGSGVSPIAMDVPGAKFILGGYDHTYSWQGVNYTDGPRAPNGSARGFLAPQFGMYGWPSTTGFGNFSAGTYGTVASYIEPFGSTAFQPAQDFPVTLGNTQTAEQAVNLVFTSTSPYQTAISYQKGSMSQGIATTEPYRYAVTFHQTGVPATATWYVNVSNGASASAPGSSGSLVVPLANGTFEWLTSLSAPNYTASPPDGPLTIAGKGAAVNLTFTPSANTVTFSASGPEFPFDWSVIIQGGPTLSGSGLTLSTSLSFAKYSYRVTCTNVSWEATHRTGTFTIGTTALKIAVTFGLVTYGVEVVPSASVSEINTARQNNGGRFNWTVTVAGIVKRGTADTAFTYDLPNGTYSFSISGLDPGYRASPSNGTFTVSGTPKHPEFPIVIQIIGPAGPWGPFGLGYVGYALVAAMAAAALLAFVVWRRRRRVPPPEPAKKPPRERRRREIPPDSI